MCAFTRGEFLGSAAAALGAGLLSGCDTEGGGTVGSPSPDLIVHAGRVHTVDPAQPMAESFAVREGRFLAVGSRTDIENLRAGDTRVVDMGDATVVPGFIDAHTHPAGAGLSELKDVNVDVRSIAEIKERMANRARETPPGEWIVGFKYDDTKLAEGRPINRRDLDEAVPDHPAVVGHRGGHTSVYNTRAFEAAGITVETPDPDGGKFYREGGELTGLVAERANYVFDSLMPDEHTPADRQAGVKLITELMARDGLTSFHDAGVSTASLRAYQDAYRGGELNCRVYMMCRGAYEPLLAAGAATGFGDEWLRVGGVKYGADGSASERTMRMSTPYVGRPDDYGILTMSQEEIHEAVEEAHRNHWQVGIHANGDVTIDMVLNAYERVQELWPRADARHRIEHCSLVNPELLTRIKAVGAVPTPFYTYVHYHGNKWVEYGPEKMEWMFAHRSFLDHDIPVAPASDYTPGPWEPLMAIQSMVTRKDFDGRIWGGNQRITVAEALRICTMGGAYASFEEGSKGSITPGKLADFVILDGDPHDTDPDAIKEIPVLMTVAGGRVTYEA
ncbi:MAG: amidohydrolase [Gemmatimonadota bacterium]|nr:amidohydrolase [Gemmatimonadota bacterium]